MKHSVPKKILQSSRRKGFTGEDYARMIALYESGQSSKEVAEEFGCTPGRILQILREYGVKTRPGPKKNLAPETLQQIIDLYEQGNSSKEIGKKYGCSAGWIRQTLREHGIIIKRKYQSKKASDDELRSIVRMYEDGSTLSEIASRFGFDRKTIGQLLDQNKVKRRKITRNGGWSRFTEQDYYRMAAMYEAGATQVEVADEFGCCRSALAGIFKKIGVEMRPAASPRDFSQEDYRQMQSMAESGKSCTDIAEHFDCEKKLIGNILCRLRSPRPKKGLDDFSETDRSRIADLYVIGLSTGGIAEEFKCGKQTVIDILASKNIPKRPKCVHDTFIAKDRRRMLAMYKSNISGAEIAEQFDCDLETLSLILNIAGMSVDPPPVFSCSDDPAAATLPEFSLFTPPVKQTNASPAPPVRDSLDTFIRNFWTAQNRAVDMMLMASDVREKIVAQVNDALKYAYEKLGPK